MATSKPKTTKRAATKRTETLKKLWSNYDAYPDRVTVRENGELIGFFSFLGAELIEQKATKPLVKWNPAAVTLRGPRIFAGAITDRDDDCNTTSALFRFGDVSEDLMPLVGKEESVQWVAIDPAGRAAVACIAEMIHARTSTLRMLRTDGLKKTIKLETAEDTAGIFDNAGRLVVVTGTSLVFFDERGARQRAVPATFRGGATMRLTVAGSFILAMDNMTHTAHVFGDSGETFSWSDPTRSVRDAALSWDGRFLFVLASECFYAVEIAKNKRVARLDESHLGEFLSSGPNGELIIHGGARGVGSFAPALPD